MSFDLLAPHYRWMEFVLAGEKLQRCRTAFLDEIPAARNILLLGEGHGRCLVECGRRFPNARITCLDASERMLDQARRQRRRHGQDEINVEFIHANVLAWRPHGRTYDLIVTNFFFDCFPRDQLWQIMAQIAPAATPDANWLVAEFQTPPTGMKRFRSRLVLWIMYVFFRAMTGLAADRLVLADPFLQSAGFALRCRAESEWGLLRSDWWSRQ